MQTGPRHRPGALGAARLPDTGGSAAHGGDRPVVEMGEFEPYAGPRRVTHASADGDRVAVTWDDGARAELHRLWLRDVCACAECRHPQTRERTFKLVDAPEPGTPEVAATPAGALSCRWADGHRSLYDPQWLYARRPDRAASAAPDRRFWTAADLPQGPVAVDHAAVMGSDAGLGRWLEALVRDGAALIRDAPTDDLEVLRVAERIGWPRETNFGRHFDVQSKPNPNNAAYTSIRLEPHVDLPNWRRAPDFQFLYCLENDADGGDSLLVDGFAAAEALAAEDPEAYRTLTAQPVDFRFQDETSDLRFRAPTIGLDADGRLAEIRFNNWIRDNQAMDPDTAERFYRGYHRFWQLLRDPRFMIAFRLAPGQMLAFDNLRVLHGREEFFPNTGRRHLQGCYVDRDLVESRLRVVARGG